MILKFSALAIISSSSGDIKLFIISTYCPP